MGTFLGVLGALVVIALVFFFIANTVGVEEGEAGRNPRLDAKVQENIKPVGAVNVGEVASASGGAAAAARSGEQVYNATCMACHGTGAAGAPKVGDKDAWGPRKDKGIDTLLDHAVNGFNAMPPKGTCMDCSEDELKAAIEHMLSQTGL